MEEGRMEAHLHGHGGERWSGIASALLLLALAAGCWAITAERMRGMDMGPGTDLGDLGWFAVVWATMMAAMMLPSLVPMALAYARASRDASAPPPVVGTAFFAAGYLLTWVGAGLLAYALVQGIRSLDPSWLAWDQAGPYVAGAVIVSAALYELTPAKSACLRHCRNPELLAREWRPGPSGALSMGLRHGGFCVGSSWALMAVLFALGVMSLTWMVVVAALVGLEKLLPSRELAIGATFVFVAVLGLTVALAPDQVPALTIPG
jgi:predicted metal-binding membrane protein